MQLEMMESRKTQNETPDMALKTPNIEAMETEATP